MQVAQLALQRQRAMLDFEEGRLPDAEMAFADLIQSLRRANRAEARYELCRALLDRATVLSFSNRWQEALEDLNACAEIGQQLGAVSSRSVLANVYQLRAKLYARPFTPLFNPQAARAELSRLRAMGFTNWWIEETAADLSYREGDWEAAAQGYRRLTQQLKNEGWARGAAASQLRAGCACLEQDNLAEAGPKIEGALAFFQQNGPPDLLAAAKIHAARLRRAQGEIEAAWQLAQDALDLVEAAIRRFRALFDQQRFVLDKLTYYQHAFAIGLAKSGPQGRWRAWTMAERAKSFYLCQLVANADIRFFAGVDPGQVAHLRALELQLDDCEAAIGRLKNAGSDPARLSPLEQQLEQLSEAKLKLQEGLMRANPRWAALRTPPAFDIAAEVRRLDSAWTPLSYFWQSQAEGATLHIFYAGKDRQPHHLAVPWSQAQLEQLDRSRDQLRGVVPPMTRILPAELVERVLPSTINDVWQSGRHLLISPHGRLRAVPVHALPIGRGERLIDLCPVQYIPTLALLPLQKPTARPERVLLMGCVQDDFGHKALEEIPHELDVLDRCWSAKRPGMVTKRLIPTHGSPAEAGLPLEKWENFDVIHLACHGDFPEGRPFDAALLLGKEAIRASEFFHTRLKVSLMSLSACALGRHMDRYAGVDLMGDEWVGLYLPLFYAGARALLVSLWDANSQVTATFMETFHGALSQGAPPPEAFQQGLQSVSRKPAPFWANWYLVGFPG